MYRLTVILLVGLLTIVKCYPRVNENVNENEKSDVKNENYLSVNETRVKYDGAQLWKVIVDENTKKAVIWQLKTEGSKYIFFLF